MRPVLALTRSRAEPLAADTLATLARRGARSLGASWPPQAPVPDGRWHVRLRVEHDHDVWLLGWGAGAGIDVHDHGEAGGALAVVHGPLVQQRVRDGDRGDVARRVLHAGAVSTFAPGERHGVENRTTGAALSLHVYSPPLASMTFFDERGESVRSEPVDLPGLWTT